jgi:signal peptidase I
MTTDVPPRRRSLAAPATIAAVILVGAVGALGVRTWAVEPVSVSSDSMAPTVDQGAIVLLSHLPWPEDASLDGRVVAFHSPQDGALVLKRVAAVAGQELAIRDGVLYVDEEVVPEPYVDPDQTDGTFFPRVTVPEGHIFVLGDNRVASVDSRDFGFVPMESITGTVLWVD